MKIINNYMFMKWLLRKGYWQGALWVTLSCLMSNICDILMKRMGSHINSFEIVFFRSFVCLILTAPFLLKKNNVFYTVQLKAHLIRIFIGTLAVVAACYSTAILPLSEVTVLSFSQPLFLLPLAALILNEKLTSKKALATLLGFIGVLIVLDPQQRGISFKIIIPLASAILFAFFDIITKRMTLSESLTTLVLYFNLGTTMVSVIPMAFSWVTPTSQDFLLLFLLGVAAALNQVCTFMSLSAATIIELIPFRYLELLFSCIFSIYLFKEHPSITLFVGAMLISVSVLFNSFYSTKQISV